MRKLLSGLACWLRPFLYKGFTKCFPKSKVIHGDPQGFRLRLHNQHMLCVCVCAGSAPSNQVNIAPWTLLAFKQLVLNHQTYVQLRSDCKYYPLKVKSLTVRADKMFFCPHVISWISVASQCQNAMASMVPDTSPSSPTSSTPTTKSSVPGLHFSTFAQQALQLPPWLNDWLIGCIQL